MLLIVHRHGAEPHGVIRPRLGGAPTPTKAPPNPAATRLTPQPPFYFVAHELIRVLSTLCMTKLVFGCSANPLN